MEPGSRLLYVSHGNAFETVNVDTGEKLETMANLGYESSKVSLVLNRSNAFTGINVKNAEGALKRTINYQVVNEYRGAISALNSGAPFMFTKADSVLGRSLLEFARVIDKAPATEARGAQRVAIPATTATAHGR